jgi:hypothetical protein
MGKIYLSAEALKRLLQMTDAEFVEISDDPEEVMERLEMMVLDLRAQLRTKDGTIKALQDQRRDAYALIDSLGSPVANKEG